MMMMKKNSTDDNDNNNNKNNNNNNNFKTSKLRSNLCTIAMHTYLFKKL